MNNIDILNKYLESYVVKFIDAIEITVIAGDGGRGYVNLQKNRMGCFLSEKRNGSNGGDGGDVWLLVDSSMNTLNYFNFHRIFRAGHGQCGRNRGCTGKKGKDVFIKVPQGTRVLNKKTNKLLGDMDSHKKCLMVAKGGCHGVGNGYYRSNLYKKINYKIYGTKGEYQNLFLELLLIADVGIFGLPNSGKSSFLRAISAAKPKVADYPFTTLTPCLGVVSVTNYDRFIIADIPGIIKGASSGSGLGVHFLKHLERCEMLLHFVDIAPADYSDPLQNIITIEHELYSYNKKFIFKPCWLIFNKIDLLEEREVYKRIKYILSSLQWTGRYYYISSMYNRNISSLCGSIMQFIINRKVQNDQ